jgi:DNA-binding response OmpR family regulator
MTAARLLLTEDDRPLADSLARLLEHEGYRVQAASTAAETLELVRRDPPDLVVLDIGLPDLNGFETCRRLRSFWAGPVIMLTARRQEVDEILGLDAGADDYVTKPFTPHRLVARIRAALRRSGQPRVGPAVRGALTLGELTIDRDARTVAVGGHPLALSTREFDLLDLLAARSGHVLTRQQLFDTVWGPEWGGDTHVLDVYVSALRKKLEGSPTPDVARSIRTVRGVGYRFEAPAAT